MNKENHSEPSAQHCLRLQPTAEGWLEHIFHGLGTVTEVGSHATISTDVFIKHLRRAREMDCLRYWLPLQRAGSVPSTYTVAHNHLKLKFQGI